MNRIDTSSITTLSQMPWKYPSLDFVQDNIEEGVSSIIKNIINQSVSGGSNNQASPTSSSGTPLVYSPTVPYLLWGGSYTYSTTGTLGTFSISEGSVFLNETVYRIPPTTFNFTATASSYVGAVATFSYDTIADPTTFSDLIPRNIHQNYVISFSATSGPGAFTNSAFNWVYQPALNTKLQNFGSKSDWLDGGTSFTMIGGTYIAANVNYNRYKIVDNVLTWQLQLQSITITSTTSLTIYMPPAILATYGKRWYCNQMQTTCMMNTSTVVRMETMNGGINYVNLYPISGTFSTGGGKTIDIFLTGEVY